MVNFAEAIFNPSLPARFGHMVMASLETSVFAVAGISAYFLLKGKDPAFYRRSMGIALIMAALFAPLQVYLGDYSGRVMFRHQPVKLAAIEAHWETNTSGGAPFAAIAFPDMEKEKNRFEIAIPNGLSLLVTHTLNGRVQGLKDFPREDRPYAPVLFWTFRVMVAIGFIFSARHDLGGGAVARRESVPKPLVSSDLSWPSSPWGSWPRSWGGSPRKWAASPGWFTT